MRCFPRFRVLCCCATVLAACAKSETQNAADSAGDRAAGSAAAAAPATMPAGAAALSLADLAGKWQMRSVPEAGDTTPTRYVLTAMADSSGWKLTFPNGLDVPGHVMALGDSLVMDAGPYASVRRKGVQVTTRSVFRREGDRLVGTTVAHYKTARPDSMLRMRSEGTRAP